jgi:hypothetical protein
MVVNKNRNNLICWGSNDELLTANSRIVEDYHRKEIYCELKLLILMRGMNSGKGHYFLLLLKGVSILGMFKSVDVTKCDQVHRVNMFSLTTFSKTLKVVIFSL